MFANGESIGHLFYVDRESVGIRHMIPLVFVIGIICGIVLSFIYRLLLYVFFAVISLYLLCDLMASIIAANEHGWKFLFPLFVLFPCVHISYGIGTIKGVVTGWKKYRGRC